MWIYQQHRYIPISTGRDSRRYTDEPIQGDKDSFTVILFQGVVVAISMFFMRSTSRALVITAKAPISGKVKTRLIPLLDVKGATDLYEAFLKDTINFVAEIGDVKRYIAYFPQGEEEYFKRISQGKRFNLIPQKGKDLGERLISIFDHLFYIGYSHIIVIGSDSPTIPLEYIEEAFLSLRTNHIVLGPCSDGGYYLIGMRAPFYRIFHDIPWSSSAVLEKTLEIAEANDYAIHLLPKWYDIDLPEDISILLKDLDGRDEEYLKNTRKFLGSFLKKRS